MADDSIPVVIEDKLDSDGANTFVVRKVYLCQNPVILTAGEFSHLLPGTAPSIVVRDKDFMAPLPNFSRY